MKLCRFSACWKEIYDILCYLTVMLFFLEIFYILLHNLNGNNEIKRMKMKIISLIFFYQLLFSISDIIGRKNMKLTGKSYFYLIKKPWLISYISMRVIAVSLMLYVFYNVYVGRAVVCSAGMSLIISALIGSIFLKEKISNKSFIAVSLIVVALILQGWR